ncbi:MAG: hypothetical protein AB7F08_03820 [Dongiaceae bacterium]
MLLRQSRKGPEVLMGRRHGRAKFLPDIYVFPGGRVEPDDRTPTGFRERLEPQFLQGLRRGGLRTDPTALLRAAIRETYEETGLMLAAGLEDEPAEPTGVWRDFHGRGLRPRFEEIGFVARAITPRGSHRRFNTRFFLADGSYAAGELTGDGELEDLAWRPAADMVRFNLVDVTEFVLAEALTVWRDGNIWRDRPPPLFSYVGESARIRRD